MESLTQLYKIGRGPSSSHTMGPQKACEYTLLHYPQATRFDVTLYGSLALTGKGHLTDKVILEILGGNRTTLSFNYDAITTHPNTMIIKIYQEDTFLDELLIESIGGGSICINGKPLCKVSDTYPFKNFEEIKKHCLLTNQSLAEVVYEYEDKSIKEYLKQVWMIMECSIQEGLNQTGELPGGLHVLRKANQLRKPMNLDESSDIKQLRSVSSFAFAVSEQNASGNTIVTAPTCGACGVLPAALYYFKEHYHFEEEKIYDALAVAGIIGNVIKTNAAISGAYAGCQSEIGSACSMAAAACAFLKNQRIEEIEYAAEIALEHHLGLTCDPIHGLVQIPCIERNAVAALRAIDASSLASFLTGTRKISFDTVVQTMFETGKDLNQNYRETSMGGLAKNYYLKDN